MKKNNALTSTVIPLLWRGTEGEAKAPSQTGFNSDWSNNATKIEALGVNHIEMLDNPNVELIMRDIFEGKRGINGFFITDKK